MSFFGYYNGEKYELANFKGYTFVKVFYHDGTGGWFNSTTALNTGSYGDKRYSRLNIIQNLKTANESKYVFCLYYPEQTSLWNIWKQTNRPQDDTNNNSNSVGYEAVQINASGSSWGGLSRSNQYAYIDGDKYSNNWWFAVGSFQNYSSTYGIPGPNDIVVTKIELWLATDISKFSFDNNTIFDFSYTGKSHCIRLAKGIYKLECWGAEGGGRRLSNNSNSGLGGYGGYSYGTLTLNEETVLYINVGGKGGSSTSGTASGGWNGGGSGYASSNTEPGNGGGGASDIRIGSNNLYARVIVAGGGGGGGEDSGDPYGHGGGTTGVNGTSSGSSNGGQTYAGTNGSFGQGATTNKGDGGGGGGGWYGGGTTSQSSVGSDTQGGGGGSGYVYTSSTSQYYPSGCLLNSNYYLTEAETVTSEHIADGYIQITALGTFYKVIYSNCTGNKTTHGIDSDCTVTVNVQNSLGIDSLLYYFGYVTNDSNLSVTKINDNQYTIVIPARLNKDVTISAIFNKREYAFNYYYQKTDLAYQFIKTVNGGISDTEPSSENIQEYNNNGFTKRIEKSDSYYLSSINVYYDRNRYTVTLNKDVGISSVSGSGTYYYEQQVTINAVVAQGYTWNRFDGDKSSYNKPYSFIMPMNSVTIKAYSIPNTNTKYTVKHYIQKSNETEYDLQETKEYVGTTGTSVQGILRSYENYITPSAQNITIKGDGTAVLNYYYNRVQYLLTLTKDEHTQSVSGSGSYIWGKTVTIRHTPDQGYHFLKWDGDRISEDQVFSFVMPIENVAIKGYSSPNTNTKYTVKHYFEKIGVDGNDYENDYVLEFTDEYHGTTDTIATTNAKTISGFTAQKEQDNVLISGDGNAIIDYYYTRNQYTLELPDENSRSDKYVYDFEEEGVLQYIDPSTISPYEFDSWIPSTFITIKDGYKSKDTTFIMPACDIIINVKIIRRARVNSNIYKNIFQRLVFDLWNIRDKLIDIERFNTQTIEVFQYRHGFSLYDVVYINNNGIYQKSIANESNYHVTGIVTEVTNENEFILTRYGKINYEIEHASDSDIIYLSDSLEGKFCFYEDITTKFYTPIGFYMNGYIILNIMDSSSGDELRKYQEHLFNFDINRLSQQDKLDIINEVSNSAW